MLCNDRYSPGELRRREIGKDATAAARGTSPVVKTAPRTRALITIPSDSVKDVLPRTTSAGAVATAVANITAAGQRGSPLPTRGGSHALLLMKTLYFK
jgi:hypothetical protein